MNQKDERLWLDALSDVLDHSHRLCCIEPLSRSLAEKTSCNIRS
jgi:hypothetical protein